MHQFRDSRSPALTAPLSLVIGVTGHRDLCPEDREALEARVRAIFVELQNRYPATPLVLLSPLAEGADRLAVQRGPVLRRQPDRPPPYGPGPVRNRFRDPGLAG